VAQEESRAIYRIVGSTEIVDAAALFAGRRLAQ